MRAHEGSCCYTCIGDQDERLWYLDEYRDDNGDPVCCCKALTDAELDAYTGN
jgi:hypothetical protein